LKILKEKLKHLKGRALKLMRKVKVFSPAHITSIFTVEDNSDPLRKGSRGVGVTLNRGVWTELEVEPSSRWRVNVRGLGSKIKGEVSRKVVEILKPKISKPYHVHITHRFEVPVGAGYGTSGGGSLGVALALNETLNLDLSLLEAANIAHLAEVECMTGLGTVLAETYGGFSLRVKAGAPSLGVVKKFKAEGFRVVSLCWGSLPTHGVLSNPALKGFIKRVGEGCLEKFAGNPTVEGFLEVSKDFSETLGLPSQKVREALSFLTLKGFKDFSMNMLGEAVFTLIQEEELPRLLKALNHPLFEDCQLTVSKISGKGVRFES